MLATLSNFYSYMTGGSTVAQCERSYKKCEDALRETNDKINRLRSSLMLDPTASTQDPLPSDLSPCEKTCLKVYQEMKNHRDVIATSIFLLKKETQNTTPLFNKIQSYSAQFHNKTNEFNQAYETCEKSSQEKRNKLEERLQPIQEETASVDEAFKEIQKDKKEHYQYLTGLLQEKSIGWHSSTINKELNELEAIFKRTITEKSSIETEKHKIHKKLKKLMTSQSEKRTDRQISSLRSKVSAFYMLQSEIHTKMLSVSNSYLTAIAKQKDWEETFTPAVNFLVEVSINVARIYFSSKSPSLCSLKPGEATPKLSLSTEHSSENADLTKELKALVDQIQTQKAKSEERAARFTRITF